ncbi:MAG: alanine racemase [Candidatus Dormibacteraeota bacterium]|nr:alanine racemase [Candidatus Dormibacteraeota bacterium]
MRWAEIDVGALRHNAAQMKATLAPSVQLLAMVKSNGYGHGAITASLAALAGGASWLGVYAPDEALALRHAGFTERLLVAGWSPRETLGALVADDVDVTVFDAAGVDAVSAAAEACGARARVHVKIDSGLGRLGARPAGLPELVDALRRTADRVEVAGVFTHFADPERNPDFTAEQHTRFLAAAEELKVVAPGALLHTCGSAAILAFPEMHHDLVRLGIALYGYAPVDLLGAVTLRPCMTVLARVAQVKDVDAGETVGYNRAWTASATRRIATVAIGYGQGIPRALSNRGSLMLGGHRCPIVGIVNMDQVTVDVTDIHGVSVGDVAMFFGVHGGVQIGADEVAAELQTIPHELICGISAQVPRISVGELAEGG